MQSLWGPVTGWGAGHGAEFIRRSLRGLTACETIRPDSVCHLVWQRSGPPQLVHHRSKPSECDSPRVQGGRGAVTPSPPSWLGFRWRVVTAANLTQARFRCAARHSQDGKPAPNHTAQCTEHFGDRRRQPLHHFFGPQQYGMMQQQRIAAARSLYTNGSTRRQPAHRGAGNRESRNRWVLLLVSAAITRSRGASA